VRCVTRTSDNLSLAQGFIPFFDSRTLITGPLRRLFWTFATGVPGAGLLVMRVVAAAAVGFKAVTGILDQFQTASAPIVALQIGAGLLLLVGLWTPLAGLLVVVLEGWLLIAQPHDPWPHILLATLGGALALVGPGAWSADARFYGWKRVDIRGRQTRANTSAEHEP
jgi:putative oxidoreductase